MAAELVGKVKQNVPGNDPRIAATSADSVSDNGCDCTGTAADLFEYRPVMLVASLVLARVSWLA